MAFGQRMLRRLFAVRVNENVGIDVRRPRSETGNFHGQVGLVVGSAQSESVIRRPAGGPCKNLVALRLTRRELTLGGH